MATERMTNRVEIDDDDVPPAPAPIATKEPSKEPVKTKEPDGADFVEIEDPQILARFKRLYRHTKEANERSEKVERQLGMLGDQNRRLAEAIGKLTSAHQDKTTRDELAALREEANTALATGDTKAFTEVNERLNEIKIEAKKADAEAKVEPVPESLVTDTELRILARWQHELDDDDKPVRPWAHRDHAEFAATQELIRKISARQDMEGATVREILAEVDKRMKRIAKEDASDDGDETPVRRAFSSPQGRPSPRAAGPQALTAQEKEIAERMFTGVGRYSVSKNAKDAHAEYLKQKTALGVAGRGIAVED